MNDLLGAMNKGLQITNGPQSMCKLQSGRCLLFCDTQGCCDTEMTEPEAVDYLAKDDAEWVVSNIVYTPATNNNLKGE